MDYRREIDGLRAVAVIPVILFHAGFEAFSGGFVGVDVFFVISGYLITSILISDLKEGRFSLLRFYERRARRILPALFLVVFCCIPFALAWMSPEQIRDFGESVIAVVFFGSNILFWREDGYFEHSAELKPLLHTWSLAVEEQYYVLFPLAILALRKWANRKVLWVIVLMALASFVLCEWARLNDSISNAAVFYLAPTRAWELLAGSLCAFVLFDRPAWRNDVLGFAGLSLILVGVFLFDENTPFPSTYALMPVVGTALVILFSASGTLCSGLLSLPVFVGMGLVSYSAYLWHQPLFAFARLRSHFDPSDGLMLGLGATSVGLAYLSWRFLEVPFRKPTAPLISSRTRLFVASGVAGAGLATLGSIAILSEEWLSDGPKAQFTALKQRISPNRGLSKICNSFLETAECRTSEAPEFLVWGDSFAMHIVQGIVASDPDVKLQQFTMSNCTPILISKDHKLIKDGFETERCADFNSSVAEWLKDHPSVEYVVISSNFGTSVDSPKTAMSLFEETVHFVESLGKQTIFFSPTPSSGYDIGHCTIRAMLDDRDESMCDFPLSGGNDRRASFALATKLSEIAPVFWLDEMICPRGTCDVIQKGFLIYRDGGHLSTEGSAFLGRTFDWADRVRAMTERE